MTLPVIVLAAFMEQLFQRIGIGLIVASAIPPDINSHIDCLTERNLRRFSLSCYIKRRSMVGRSPHIRKPAVKLTPSSIDNALNGASPWS